jgi:predicted ATPase
MTTIRTPDQRVRVFVSSTMKELAPARAAARRAIERLRLVPVLFELGARPYPPRELYLAYLQQSDIFIGIYGRQYGWIAPGQQVSGLEDEYLNAGGKPKLIYVQSPAPERDPRLTAMLERISSDGLSYRGFARPEQLAALIADDLAVLLSERFNVGQQQREVAERHRPLPVPASRFVGRARHIAVVRDLLTDGDARLVTLVGPGGIGKTRMALQVGASLIAQFDAVQMAELDEVSTPDLVISSIAAALGAPESPGQPLFERMIDYVRGRRVLLIVDNFEHVIAAAPVLGQLIARTDRLVLLVTSRERLRLSGEQVVDVPPLAVPDPSENADGARRAEAVELFLDRARAAGADLPVNEGTLVTVAEICRRLEGVPLAIELAASRSRIVGLDDLLQRLDSRLSFLIGGPRDLPARQHALRSTIAWSHDLLTDADRRLFARLGVFAAGFSLQAAESVCADDTGPPILDGIASLVDKSLVRTEDGVHGRPRFTMLQVIRDFALEQLEARGEAEQLQRAHADYFREVVIATEQRLRADPAGVIEQYRADQANIRSAIRWSLANKESGRVAGMVAAMWPFLWDAGSFAEGIEIAQQTLRDEAGLSVPERAHAYLAWGTLAFGHGDYDQATPVLATAIDLYTELGDRRRAATASVSLGVIQAVRDRDRGEQLLTRAAAAFRALDDTWGLAFALLGLGGALLLHDRYDEALPPLEESVRLARSVQADVFLSNALINLGWVQLRRGDLESARRWLRESTEHAAALDNRESLARALEALAAVEEAAGRPEQGGVLFGAAAGIRHSIGAAVWATDRDSHDQTATQLRARLGDAAYHTATEHGRGLTPDEALQTTAFP